MRRIALLSFLLISIISFSQQTNDCLLTDSTSLLGVLSKGVFGNTIATKYGSEKYIPESTVVHICGAAETQEYSSKTKYYQVVYRGKPYYVESSDVTFIGDCDFIDKILSMDTVSYNKFNKHSISAGMNMHLYKLERAVKFFDKCKPSGLCLLQKKIYDESEYTSGTSVKLTVYNPSKHAIKYISFYMVGYNAVGDAVGTTVIRKGIGPIESDATSAYTFEYAWFTDLVETFKISQIQVQFMDKKIKPKIIKNVKSITMGSDDYETLFGEVSEE